MSRPKKTSTTISGTAARAKLDAATELAHRRFGFRQRDSAYRWEYADPRFDSAVNPAESLKFGWIVELDPFDADSRPKKRTALGRFKHECATTVLARDGRAVVYMGDDQQFEYFYKFVSRGRFDPERPEANRDLLDDGTLYVARFDEDGRGEWLPLVHGAQRELTPERGFASQGDVVLRCREAADRLGATPLDRPEDVAVNPRTGNVYVACTQNLGRDEGVVEVGGTHARHAHGSREPTRAERGGPHPRDHRAERRRGSDVVQLGDLPAGRRAERATARRDVTVRARGVARRGAHVFRRRDGCGRAQRVRESRQLGL